jgi:hypothetical protein
MVPSPPVLPTREPADAAVGVSAPGDRDGADRICFAVRDAPEQCGWTEPRADGSLVMCTAVEGRVLAVTREEFVVDLGLRHATVRTLLPDVVQLSMLEGRRVRVVVAHTCRRRGVTTIDVMIRDEAGVELLWARDGSLPKSRDAAVARVRVAWSSDGPRLVFAIGPHIGAAKPHELIELGSGEARYAALALRAGRDAASFVVIRR